MKLQEIGEFGLIDLIKPGTIVDESSIIAGIGDDAAVILPRPHQLQLMTADMLVEGIHFDLNTTSAWQLGYKAMAVNFSDIAAMGGTPRQAVVSIAIPPTTTVEFVVDVYAGMKEICREYKVNIVGGDTVACLQGIVLNVTVLGEAAPAAIVQRSGAQIGDIVAVTGTLGNSSCGLDLLQDNHWVNLEFAGPLVAAHLTPRPQVELGNLLAVSGANSMDDISDGLASEVHEIAGASQVGMEIFADNIPLSPELITASEYFHKPALEYALYGGEDYQLLVTMNPANYTALMHQYEGDRCPITAIGRVVSQQAGITLVDSAGQNRSLVAHGYNHFR